MPNPKQPHYIIAMGAGGINEINGFFDQTPGDDVSYIILEDLSPDFKSRMAVLLAGHSRLQVKEAEDNMWVECNKVYLIPGNKYMIIRNGRLHLINKGKKQAPYLNINKFFTPQASASDSIITIFSDAHFGGAEEIGSINKEWISSGELTGEKIYHGQYMTHARSELSKIKYELQIAYERPDAFIENMQPLLENLISANKEMQITNGNMEFTTQELHAINWEYRVRNKELIENNNELNNYFMSNINGQLFVNAELLLIKFSPCTKNYIGIRDTDIGCHIEDISTDMQFEKMVSDVKEVLTNGNVITREGEGTNGRWHHMTTMPYIRQTDNKTDGVIISFNDITELKLIQLELERTNKSLININKDLDNFVHTASHDLLARLLISN